MPEPRTPDDIEILSAHPGFSAIQDGIDYLDGAACMPGSAAAVRLLDAQNDARGREIDRYAAVLGTVRDGLAERIRYADDMVKLCEGDGNQRALWSWTERHRTFADALALIEKRLDAIFGPGTVPAATDNERQ
jgi:hypothetical protein